MVVGIAGLTLAGPALAYPAGTAPAADVDHTVFAPGGNATVTVDHFLPGGILTLSIESTPVVIGYGTVVPASGTATISGAMPAGYSGPHTLIVTSNKGERFDFAITITSSSSGSGSTSSSGGLASTGAAVTGIGILGAGLVAGGVFFVMAGRRRANSTSA